MFFNLREKFYFERKYFHCSAGILVRRLPPVFLLIYLLGINNAHAGLFSNSTYEECLLEDAIGVSIDIAARHVEKNCRKLPSVKERNEKPPLFFANNLKDCLDEYLPKANSKLGGVYARKSCAALTAPHNQSKCKIFIYEIRDNNEELLSPYSNFEIVEEFTKKGCFSEICVEAKNHCN